LAGDAIKTLYIGGNDKTVSLFVTATGLKPTQEIKITCPFGFTLSHTTLPYNANNVEVIIGLESTKPVSEGEVIVKAGTMYKTYYVIGYGTPLEKKDISGNPVYTGGSDEAFEISEAGGFAPTGNGFTIEFSVKAPNVISTFTPYAITSKGTGFESLIGKETFSMKNGELTWRNYPFVNKESVENGGTGVFYPDDEYHTYRYAVTPDDRIFVYRDGALVDILRACDFGLQPHFVEGEGEMAENLLSNPGFEGEYEVLSDDASIAKSIQGWDVAVADRWNSYQSIAKQEIDKDHDHNNHVLKANTYHWADGWGAAEYGQIVNVVPGETYTFSALAKGGYYESTGEWYGSLRVQEVKSGQAINEQKVEITSDTWEEYSMDYTTSATCKQIRALLYLERTTWGSSVSMEVDDARLTGKKVTYPNKAGFTNKSADIEYFACDLTGAYAPEASMDVIVVGIEKVKKLDQITAHVNSGLVYLKNVPQFSRVSVYNVNGSLVEMVNNYNGDGIKLPQKGLYIAVIRKEAQAHSVKVLY
jgi:hypothetical protein